MKFTLRPGTLTLSDIKLLLQPETSLELHPDCIKGIHASEKMIHEAIQNGKCMYGINTGFGALAGTRIDDDQLSELQTRIVLSHAAGVGDFFSDDTVRLIMALKINSLARGYSGVKLSTIEALITLFNKQVYPAIPCQGSVGASGDLAPLAHMSTLLLGVGEARYQGNIISAQEALSIAGITLLALGPKEGLALLNGTQASTALALLGLLGTEHVFSAAICAGALSVDAAHGSDTPFDARISAVRGHAGQIDVAAMFRFLLQESAIRHSHRDCAKVQDPYSLRCQPQVMGACLTQMRYVESILITEANAVSDNPLLFVDDDAILSGGNFHAEPVAFAADALAICLAEIGNLSERRIALLMDPQHSKLPAFLVDDAGINSGFMIAQVTAAALASENKCIAHPASVDTIPTSANQEDHVSMATHAARRLLAMTENTANIIAIELLAAAQGIDFRAPLTTSPNLSKIQQLIRKKVDFYAKDRYFGPDIKKIKTLLQSGAFRDVLNDPLTPSSSG